jgi:1,4-dihydroxy-2-naphthoate octaprenyltransferase
LIVAGSVYALCGRLDGAAFAVGAPLGMLTAAILWINEIPDVPADAKAGKTTLVVTLGPRRAAVGYVIIVGLAFVSLIAEVALGALPIWSLIALAPLPLAVRAARIALAHHSDRTLVRANAGTIQLQLAVGALLTLGSVVAGW